jgi:hypothetical protein
LSIGTQATQASHCAIDFQYEHPKISNCWHKSNYLILLTVKNEEELKELIIKATLRGIKHTIFREPDFHNEITAVAFEPSNESQKLTSSLPLLGKDIKYV